MMEFDKSRILTAVTADQAKVGDIGWFGDSVAELRRAIDSFGPTRLELVADDDSCNRFAHCTSLRYALFYPAPYEFLQEQWVKENSIKVGDKVMVWEKWEDGPEGSGYEKSTLVEKGDVFKIAKIESGCLVCSGKAFHCNVDTGWRLPFFAVRRVMGGYTYAELQEQWVKDNGLNVGDKVKVVRAWEYDEHGFKGLHITHYLEVVGAVIGINDHGIKIQTEKFQAMVPCFAIEKVKEPEYRPFANAEEFAPHRDKWFSWVGGDEGDACRVTSYGDDGVVIGGSVIDYERFCDEWCFSSDTGKSAGVKV